MASLDMNLGTMQRAMRGALGANWQLLMIQGIAMIILGVVAVIWPFVATIAFAFFVGWLFLISGIVGLVAMFSASDTPAFLWTLVTAALSIVAGALLIWKPVEGAVSLTLVLGVFFIAEGIFQIVTSTAYRDALAGSWGWMLASGIADLVLALIVILGWPESGTWVLGLLVGINLATSGGAMVIAAFEGRKYA